MKFMQNSAHFLSPLGKSQAGLCGDTVLIARIAVWPSAQITAVLQVYHVHWFCSQHFRCISVQNVSIKKPRGFAQEVRN